jgi:hypothetical protein
VGAGSTPAASTNAWDLFRTKWRLRAELQGGFSTGWRLRAELSETIVGAWILLVEIVR